MSDMFDFGFTAVDESELNVYQEAQQKVEETTQVVNATDLFICYQPL